MAHCAQPHHRIPALHVRLGVPGQRGNATARPDAQIMKHRSHALGTFTKPGIPDAGRAAVRTRRHDFCPGAPLRCMVKKLVERECVVLDCTVDHWHCNSFGGKGGERTPTFQFHGMWPAARRRHTTSSCKAKRSRASIGQDCGCSAKTMPVAWPP